MSPIPASYAPPPRGLYSPQLQGVLAWGSTMSRDESGKPGGGDRPGHAGPVGVSSVELVVRARGGDRQALDRLFERYLPLLRRWAAGRLPRWARDLVDTDDMIQDTLMRTFRNVRSGRTSSGI